MKEMLYIGFGLVALAFGVLIIIIVLFSFPRVPVYNKNNFVKRFLKNLRRKRKR